MDVLLVMCKFKHDSSNAPIKIAFQCSGDIVTGYAI